MGQMGENPAYKKFVTENSVTEVVQCETLSALLNKHNLSSPDLLVIDAEGYDFEILKTIDFAHTKPKYINYEHALLSNTRSLKA